MWFSCYITLVAVSRAGCQDAAKRIYLITVFFRKCIFPARSFVILVKTNIIRVDGEGNLLFPRELLNSYSQYANTAVATNITFYWFDT